MSITFNIHSPIHRQTENRPSSRLATLGMSWLRASVAIAKRAYPIVCGIAICVVAIAATLALRVAIWLPMFLHH
jgi:hypothetical protein